MAAGAGDDDCCARNLRKEGSVDKPSTFVLSFSCRSLKKESLRLSERVLSDNEVFLVGTLAVVAWDPTDTASARMTILEGSLYSFGFVWPEFLEDTLVESILRCFRGVTGCTASVIESGATGKGLLGDIGGERECRELIEGDGRPT